MDTEQSEAVYATIRARRDVRGQFTGGPIPPEVLARLLAAAHAAPSVGLSQPWDFVVVADPTTRRRFRDHVHHQRAAFRSTLPPERRATFDPIRIEGIEESTVGVVVTYDPGRGGPHVLGRHSIADAGLYSTCLAIQNLWLAATAEGYGLGWVSFFEEDFVRQLLGIPDRVRPVAWLCLGPVTHLETVPDLERHRWEQRRAVETVTHHERW